MYRRTRTTLPSECRFSGGRTPPKGPRRTLLQTILVPGALALSFCDASLSCSAFHFNSVVEFVGCLPPALLTECGWVYDPYAHHRTIALFFLIVLHRVPVPVPRREPLGPPAPSSMTSDDVDWKQLSSEFRQLLLPGALEPKEIHATYHRTFRKVGARGWEGIGFVAHAGRSLTSRWS